MVLMYFELLEEKLNFGPTYKPFLSSNEKSAGDEKVASSTQIKTSSEGSELFQRKNGKPLGHPRKEWEFYEVPKLATIDSETLS